MEWFIKQVEKIRPGTYPGANPVMEVRYPAVRYLCTFSGLLRGSTHSVFFHAYCHSLPFDWLLRCTFHQAGRIMGNVHLNLLLEAVEEGCFNGTNSTDIKVFKRFYI